MTGFSFPAQSKAVTSRKSWCEPMVLPMIFRSLYAMRVPSGLGTAVTEKTTDIFLEAAFFSQDVIAGRARSYGMHTDASLRFERGVDPEGQGRAVERATELLLSIAGGDAISWPSSCMRWASSSEA